VNDNTSAHVLAARLKVASMVTGTPDLSTRDDTWCDLVGLMRTEAGRASAESAWRGVCDQTYVSAARVERYVRTALERMAQAPNEPHHLRSLMSPVEIRVQLEELCGPVRDIPDRRCHEMFADRVREHPDAIAAVAGEQSWTYRELNAKANKIARALRRRGLRDEDVVAVVMARSLDWLAAVLGVFKAGGCYLPLEPGFPAGRINAVLDRSECRWMLADPTVPRPTVRAVELSYVDEILAGAGREDDLDVPVGADQLAYIYFTSGSTGEPKGAMCEHRGFLNHVLAKIEDLGIGEGDVVAQTAPQCFDISLWQLVSALLVGGRTHIVEQPAVLDVHRFVDTLASGEVTVVQLVPSYLEVVLTALAERPRALPALHRVSVTGEALPKELTQRWFAAFPDVALVNAYGLTETCDDTNHEILHGVPDGRSVPIGRPIRNARVYVVDQRMQLVPIGVPGEIVFSGVCVGRGYVNDEARTKAAFGPDPYRPGQRLYRSGDYGRWLPSRSLEFLGRRDSQVKVNGFRIEIGEIENRMLQVPGVRDAAVVVAGTEARPQLVGYYSGESAPGADHVGDVLSATLPSYMVPRRLYRRPELPLTANGKTDRKALLRLSITTEQAAEAPATPTEQRVARLWARLLKIPVERIGRWSRFAEFGGTSLTAIRLAIALDRAVTVGELADTPTVADVAALLDLKSREAVG
jgi:amino acid adenylation domain-containing protein